MSVVRRGPVLYRRWSEHVIATMVTGDERWLVGGLAAELWHLLDKPRSMDFLLAMVADRHHAPPDRVARDVRLALQSLGPLVETTGGGSATAGGPLAVPLPQAHPPIVDRLWLATGSALGRHGAVAVAALQRSAGFRPADPGRRVSTDDVAACLAERVLPGLADALDEGALDADDDVRQLVRETDQGVQVLALTLEQTLLAVVEVMHRLDMDHRVLKGLATAHLDHGESRTRHTGDVDLLVRTADIDRLAAALVESGFTSLVDNPGPTALFQGVTLVSPDGVEVDLHHRLVRHGRAVDDRAWADPEVFELAGRQVFAVGRDARRFHATAHALISTAGARRLGGHVDAMLLGGAGSEPNAMALAAGLGGSLARAEQLGSQLLGASTDAEASLNGVRDRACWRAFGRPERAVFAEQISLMLALPVRTWPAWVHSWLRPDEEYRVAWGRERGGHLRYLGSKVTRSGRR